MFFIRCLSFWTGIHIGVDYERSEPPALIRYILARGSFNMRTVEDDWPQGGPGFRKLLSDIAQRPSVWIHFDTHITFEKCVFVWNSISKVIDCAVPPVKERSCLTQGPDLFSVAYYSTPRSIISDDCWRHCLVVYVTLYGCRIHQVGNRY